MIYQQLQLIIGQDVFESVQIIVKGVGLVVKDIHIETCPWQINVQCWQAPELPRLNCMCHLANSKLG